MLFLIALIILIGAVLAWLIGRRLLARTGLPVATFFTPTSAAPFRNRSPSRPYVMVSSASPTTWFASQKELLQLS